MHRDREINSSSDSGSEPDGYASPEGQLAWQRVGVRLPDDVFDARRVLPLLLQLVQPLGGVGAPPVAADVHVHHDLRRVGLEVRVPLGGVPGGGLRGLTLVGHHHLAQP